LLFTIEESPIVKLQKSGCELFYILAQVEAIKTDIVKVDNKAAQELEKPHSLSRNWAKFIVRKLTGNNLLIINH